MALPFIRFVTLLSVCFTDSNCLSHLIVCNYNSACIFFLSVFALFLFLLGFCNLVRTFEEYTDSLLKVKNCKFLPVFCYDDISEINRFYYCDFHSMCSLLTFSVSYIFPEIGSIYLCKCFFVFSSVSFRESQLRATNLLTIIFDVSSWEILVAKYFL